MKPHNPEGFANRLNLQIKLHRISEPGELLKRMNYQLSNGLTPEKHQVQLPTKLFDNISRTRKQSQITQASSSPPDRSSKFARAVQSLVDDGYVTSRDANLNALRCIPPTFKLSRHSLKSTVSKQLPLIVPKSQNILYNDEFMHGHTYQQ